MIDFKLKKHLFKELIERLKVTRCVLYPNIVRDLMKYDDDWIAKHDLSQLKVISLGKQMLRNDCGDRVSFSEQF